MTLLGYTSMKNKRPCLIYELLPQGSLRDRLDCLENSPPLLWHKRISIVWEISMALAFIHESHPEIQISTVHFDVKSANILLDDHYKAKLADFGLVRNVNPQSEHQQDEDSAKGTYGAHLLLLSLLLLSIPLKLTQFFPFPFNLLTRVPLPRIPENRKMQR